MAKATVNINTCELIASDFSARQAKLILAWAELHRDELLADWELASCGELPFKIEPLR